MNQNTKLVVYTSSGCSKCAMLKKWLKDRGFGFGEKPLDTDVIADLAMKNIVVLSAPVLEAEGIFYTENQVFDGDKLLDAELLRILEG